MQVNADSIPHVVRSARESSRLSKVEFARAAGTTRAAIDEYEKGVRMPRVDSLLQILEPAALTLQIDPLAPVRAESNRLSLASFVKSVESDDSSWLWRTLVSDFVANEFAPALIAERAYLLDEQPTTTGSQHWDSFIAALAEHLSFHAQLASPRWIDAVDRGALNQYWWPVHGSLPTMRSAAMAFTPAAFRRRRILIDGRELPVIVP